MSLLSLIAKIGSVVTVAGTAIAVPVVISSKKSNSREADKVPALKIQSNSFTQKSLHDLSVEETSKRGECFIIGTEVASENQKFLICANSDKYYLYKDKSFTKIIKISGPDSNKQITITLDKEQDKTHTLTLADNKWKKVPENLDFHKNCYNVKVDNNKPALFCSQSSPRYWSETIDLVVFNAETN